MVITIGTPQPCQEIRVGIWGELVIARTAEDFNTIHEESGRGSQTLAVVHYHLYDFACVAFAEGGDTFLDNKALFCQIVREASFLSCSQFVVPSRTIEILYETLKARARANGLWGQYGVIGLPGLVGEGIVKIYGGK